MFLLFAFLFGLIIGSFLNVVIHRVPRGESIVLPGSHCPHCNRPIRWYENVPLLSYLALRGRCRGCSARISPRYILVELLTGLVFLGLAAMFGPGVELVKYWVFAGMMIALSFIDLGERILPDVITFPGMALGVFFSLLAPVDDGVAAFLLHKAGLLIESWRVRSLADSLLGGAAAAGLIWLVGEVYFRVRKQEGMGFGDVKLMAVVGAFLGLKLALLTVFLGSFAGTLVGGGYMLMARKERTYELPFGTFLGLVAIVSTVWGKEIVNWYFSRAF